MPITFFDCCEPFPRPGVANLDRVYRLAWHNFTPAQWEALDRIYQDLPGWRGYRECPCWYGTDERVSPHLTASVEPPGLQVTGLLPAPDFEVWHERFLNAIADFPARDPGDDIPVLPREVTSVARDAERERRQRRQMRTVMSVFATLVGVWMAIFEKDTYINGLYAPWLGYVLIAIGVLALFGVNVFWGGPLDKRLDR